MVCLLLLLGLTSAYALEWMACPGGRYAVVDFAKTGQPGFTLLPPESTGIFFTNVLSEIRYTTNQVLLNGSGVACGDIDGDGWCDIYFCGLDSHNKLYRNLGNWKFEDITEAAGVACPNMDCTGAVFADIDGNGTLDLIVNSLGHGTRVFLNDGKGHFTPSPKNPILNGNSAGTSLALADIDGNGTLDLYIANYRLGSLRDQPETRFSIRMVDGRPTVVAINGRSVEAPDLANRFVFSVTQDGSAVVYSELGEPDMLYRNDGTGKFTAASWTDGTFLDEAGKPLTKPLYDWGLSVMFRDLNGDGAPDIYVCNDFKTPDRIWINDGRGHFKPIDRLALRQTSLSSMGIDVADLNRDGHDEIFVVDMLSRDHRHRFMQRIDIKPEILPIGAIGNRPQTSRNTLFLNRGDGTYAEIAQFAGLEASEWSWMPVFLDVDLDGYEDLLIPNGFERDSLDLDIAAQIERKKREKQVPPLEQLQLRKLFPRLDTANLAFRNLGHLKFEDASAAWGFNARSVSQAIALADLDNDGDLDVVVNNMNGPAFVYRNNVPAPRLGVRLKGKAPNTRGIGAKIKVLGGPVPQSQEMICGGRYQSADDNMRVFAAGSPDVRLSIEVLWRGGLRSLLTDVKANRIYEVDESFAQPYPPPAITPPQPMFEDVSHLLKHRHHEEPFDDFALQPLLVNRLSQLGPGVTWTDLDGDGWDDLVIGSGRGGTLGAFRNDGHGGFTPFAGAPFDQPVTRDQTAILPLQREDGTRLLLAGSANYEDGLAAGSSARTYNLAAKSVEDVLPGQESSTGPMALADIDGDGILDLFIGGRVISGRYPQAASSVLLRGTKTGFVVDAANTERLKNVGLVTAAVFSDLDGDGFPELILACEWGPIRVFHNESGQLIDATARLGLDKYLGWWNGVGIGDFDGDGRLDIVAANWGRNNKFESLRAGAPVYIYFGDFDGNGTIECPLAYFDLAMKKLVPCQPLSQAAAAFPLLRERIATCGAYSSLNIDEIYGEPFKSAHKLQANWFDSTVFLNRGDHFEARILPMEAQLSPAFAVCVGDLDGDGAQDIFLSQNFFAVEPETSRYDAGRGLLLKGNGKGDFQAIPGQQSGLKIYGEQRGAALCDFDGDGRLDLAVSQNAAETKLYKNVTAQPGLRVRLKGPPGNPTGIGVVLRLANDGKPGPACEIHAGSGYWSHDSVVPVLTSSSTPDQVWVRWPAGKVFKLPLPAKAREVIVDYSGKIQDSR